MTRLIDSGRTNVRDSYMAVKVSYRSHRSMGGTRIDRVYQSMPANPSKSLIVSGQIATPIRENYADM